jgi:hypothetical protein
MTIHFVMPPMKLKIFSPPQIPSLSKDQKQPPCNDRNHTRIPSFLRNLLRARYLRLPKPHQFSLHNPDSKAPERLILSSSYPPDHPSPDPRRICSLQRDHLIDTRRGKRRVYVRETSDSRRSDQLVRDISLITASVARH